MSRPDWFLDELAFAGRENLDRAHVERYDDKEDSAAAAELELLRSLGLDAGSVVVEFGPGTGQLALHAARECARWIAVDISPPMLERLRCKRDAAAIDPARLELVNAGFLSFDGRGGPADFVYSRLALHHIPDQWKAVALARMRGLLAPGGVLRLSDVVFSCEPHELEQRIGLWRSKFPVSAAEGEWVRGDLDEHLRDEHSTFTWLLEPMIERAGFEIARREHSEDGIWARYVARAV